MLKFPEVIENGSSYSYYNSFLYSPSEKKIGSCLWIPTYQKKIIDIRYPEFYINLLIKGDVTYINDKGKEYVLKPGDIFFRRPNQTHSIIRRKIGHGLEFFLRLPSNIYEGLVKLGIIDSGIYVKHIEIDQLLVDRLIDFIDNLGSYTPKELPLFLIEAQKLLYYLNTREEHSEKNEYIRKKINQACQYLSEDFNQKLLVPDIAKKLGMGYHNFRREFNRITGISPMEFRIRKRIEKADYMLRVDNFTLKETAERLGYPDFASFAKQYKKFTGHSPGTTKKENDLDFIFH